MLVSLWVVDFRTLLLSFCLLKVFTWSLTLLSYKMTNLGLLSYRNHEFLHSTVFFGLILAVFMLWTKFSSSSWLLAPLWRYPNAEFYMTKACMSLVPSSVLYIKNLVLVSVGETQSKCPSYWSTSPQLPSICKLPGTWFRVSMLKDIKKWRKTSKILAKRFLNQIHLKDEA